MELDKIQEKAVEFHKKWSDTCGTEHGLPFNDWIVEQLALSESNCDNWRRQCLDADAIQNRRNEALQRFLGKLDDLSRGMKVIDTMAFNIALEDFRKEIGDDKDLRGTR